MWRQLSKCLVAYSVRNFLLIFTRISAKTMFQFQRFAAIFGANGLFFAIRLTGLGLCSTIPIWGSLRSLILSDTLAKEGLSSNIFAAVGFTPRRQAFATWFGWAFLRFQNLPNCLLHQKSISNLRSSAVALNRRWHCSNESIICRTKFGRDWNRINLVSIARSDSFRNP